MDTGLDNAAGGEGERVLGEVGKATARLLCRIAHPLDVLVDPVEAGLDVRRIRVDVNYQFAVGHLGLLPIVSSGVPH